MAMTYIKDQTQFGQSAFGRSSAAEAEARAFATRNWFIPVRKRRRRVKFAKHGLCDLAPKRWFGRMNDRAVVNKAVGPIVREQKRSVEVDETCARR